MTFQYIIYDWDALIADVGGFLGLLIGQSAYGVFEAMTKWMKGSKIIKDQHVNDERRDIYITFNYRVFDLHKLSL